MEVDVKVLQERVAKGFTEAQAKLQALDNERVVLVEEIVQARPDPRLRELDGKRQPLIQELLRLQGEFRLLQSLDGKKDEALPGMPATS